MSYIRKEERERIDQSKIENVDIKTSRQLSYIILKLAKRYTKSEAVSPSMHAINSALGAIENAKQSFYKEVAAPFEKQNKFDHGEID